MYDGNRVLGDVDLLNPPGRGAWAAIGPNGAGKSTLLKIIGGVVSPSAGSVVINGEEIDPDSYAPLGRLQARRSYTVHQRVSLFLEPERGRELSVITVDACPEAIAAKSAIDDPDGA